VYSLSSNSHPVVSLSNRWRHRSFLLLCSITNSCLK
jgi:hypothetical protein